MNTMCRGEKGLLDQIALFQTYHNFVLLHASLRQPLPRIPDRMHVDKVSALFPLFFGVADSSADTAGNCKN